MPILIHLRNLAVANPQRSSTVLSSIVLDAKTRLRTFSVLRGKDRAAQQESPKFIAQLVVQMK